MLRPSAPPATHNNGDRHRRSSTASSTLHVKQLAVFTGPFSRLADDG
jgi:hypothetical protein